MKVLYITILFFAIFHSIDSFAQNNKLFIHREVQEAIEKGTRTMDGKPGPQYWQNKIDYTIEAGFNPETGELKGKETVVYKNNSHLLPPFLTFILLLCNSN